MVPYPPHYDTARMEILAPSIADYFRYVQPKRDEAAERVLEYNRLAFSTPDVLLSLLPNGEGFPVSHQQ